MKYAASSSVSLCESGLFIQSQLFAVPDSEKRSFELILFSLKSVLVFYL